jgi:hypothetical protein
LSGHRFATAALAWRLNVTVIDWVHMSEESEIQPSDNRQEGTEGSKSVPEDQTLTNGGVNEMKEDKTNGVKETVKAEPSTSPRISAVKAESESSILNSNDEKIDLTRKGEAPQPSKSQKKRRIIDDEDESDDQSASSLGKSKTSSVLDNLDSGNKDDASDDGKDNAPSVRTTRSSRIRSVSAKSRPSIRDDDDNDTEAPRPTKRPEAPSSWAAKGESPKHGESIPKKKVPRKAAADASTEAPSKSSLLGKIEQPPAASPSIAATRRVTTGSTIILTKYLVKTEPKGQARPQAAASTPDAAKERKLQNFIAAQANKPSSLVSSPAGGGVSWSEGLVMQDLQDICNRCSEDVNFELRPTSPSTKVDLSGSFLDEDPYDFFDTNERGEIVIAPRPPIFPEEFPKGMKEHSLSWWGILDPALGDGKYRSAPSIPDPRSAMGNGTSDSRQPPPPEIHLPTQVPTPQAGRGGDGFGRGPGPDEGQWGGQDASHGVHPGRGGQGWGRGPGRDKGRRDGDGSHAGRGGEARGRGPGRDEGQRGGDGRRPFDGPYHGHPPDSWNGPGRPQPQPHPYGPPRNQGRR